MPLRVVVVGTGRVATALAHGIAGLREQPCAAEDLDVELIGVTGRDEAAAHDLAAACRTSALPLAVATAGADLVVLSVSDDAIPAVAARLAGAGAPGREGGAAVHVSGATGRDALTPLAAVGWATGCWHPLQAFATRRSRIDPGSLWTVTADPALTRTVTALTARLGGQAHSLADDHRAVYHAAATLAVTSAVAGIAQAQELLSRCGLGDAPTVPALARLVAGSLAGVAEVGPAQGLTGPLVRGDLGTVRRHAAALAEQPPARDLYAASGRAVIPLLEERGLAPEVTAALAGALAWELDGPPGT
ncbi:DUF2520 domain-containing protein [Arsenicicoccus cauae]|uniref:DUF2520 domain-containing protein n=1 Tax=Arsenicicoccus cauae TaxID=2663847 RepID=UPI00370D3761